MPAPANISLGVLGGGYHLLEFEFVERWRGGKLQFHVATATGEKAWLVRFRVYVPNSGDNDVRYIVKTQTCFPGGTFFLGGYADDYIDDVMVDAGLLWQDWMWNMGSYGAIYAWGDGFMYPLSWQYGQHLVTFAFGEIWLSGVLDFQYISWTNQRNKIEPPKFCAIGNLNQLDPSSAHPIDSAMFYGGSMWKEESDPEFSERYFETRQVINVGSLGIFEVGLGLGWAEWALLPGTEDDVGITLNFTNTYFSTEEDPPWYYWEFSLRNTMIEIYSFPALEIEGIEYEEHDSFVRPDLIATMDYTGTVIMFVSGALLPTGAPAKIGATVGLGIKGIATAIKIAEGQQVSRFKQIITDDHNYQVQSQKDWTMRPLETKSDVVFFKLNTVMGKHCGLIKIVFKTTLDAIWWHWTDFGPMPVPFALADITTTIHIPCFLRG
ncbi:MAG: hypothetical protein QHH24_01745 [Candidatus Bathyarchaeota archaeon]|nr:hypothetical protein [Candidatus Bathyarchaeota archaeon]